MVVGTHTYGKGVFQEIDPLPNGGALDFTVGEYFTPNGQNLGGGGVKEGHGHHAQRLRRTPAPTPTSTRRCRPPSGRWPPRCGEPGEPDRGRRSPRVAVLARRGKFLVAEPFFGAGPADGRQPGPPGGGRRPDRRARRDRPQRPRRAGGRRSTRRLGRPDVARDVIEGADGRPRPAAPFDPAVEHERGRCQQRRRRARGRLGIERRTRARPIVATCARCRRSRSTR